MAAINRTNGMDNSDKLHSNCPRCTCDIFEYDNLGDQSLDFLLRPPTIDLVTQVQELQIE
jgi:hypothetical protein